MPNWRSVATVLAAAGIHVDEASKPLAVAGGDISAAWRVPIKNGQVFLKTGSAQEIEMFSAERDALAEIAATGTVKVPAPLALGTDGKSSLLVLEWLQLGATTTHTGERFGQKLAALHRNTASEFGWYRDNTIGRTPQPNSRSENWLSFFREQRLEFQLQLAAQRGYNDELQEEGAWLCANLASLFTGYDPQPSLLHGDLWGGNWAACDGEPVMFDPATYYGDRETDLAMTRLFGGFPASFYTAYEASWPLARGAAGRQTLYQLYHVLNHLNLFGPSFEGRALALMRELRVSIERQASRG